MKTAVALIIGRESEHSEKQNMIWNMIGSFLYAFASMVLSIAVVQIAGEDAGGVFTFAYTTFGQHMFTVAYFGIRPFQITDTGQYTFGEYLGLRLLTCAGTLLFGLGYASLHGYGFVKASVVFLMVAYKVIDALADTYEAEFQRRGRLYLTGKSNAFRTIFSVTVFLGTLKFSGGNLLTASGAAVAAQAAGFFIFDAAVIRELPGVDWSVRKGKKAALLRDNTLLFFSVVLDFYIFSASKYAVESCMTDRDMAAYGAIFMPTSVINLVAGFVIRPYLTRLSLDWELGRVSRFWKQILRLSAMIGGLTILALGGAWLLGIPVLSLLYSNLREDLVSCRTALLFIILGGALNAYMNLFYYSLIIMKKQRFIMAGYGLTALFALTVSRPFVLSGGLLGGAMSYAALMALLAAVFGAVMAAGIWKKERNHG